MRESAPAQDSGRYQIHLIRHGATAGTRDGLLYGKSNIPLLPEGAEALRAFAADGVYPDPAGCAFFSSGMLRAVESLEAIYGARAHAYIEELQEFDCGVFEMRPYGELSQSETYKRWIADKNGETPAPGGESFAAFRRRVAAGAARLLAPYRDGRATHDSIVVCHGGVISMMMDRFFPGVHDNPFRWTPDPGRGYSVTVNGGTAEGYIGL
ncbi:MAG: histidine phosphatase family protein [Clostridiales Family XIII bacterium]|jgi:broad specificity phosphatase PhoE|nr:histidine phosphatase family protein [Clostridiales Family XIII bacterium]